jgi:hypothetical protein
MIDAGSIPIVLDVLRPERAALLTTLEGLDGEDWNRPTECPAWSVQGIATHLLGDDFSLLSRQRDSAEPGLFAVAARRTACSPRSSGGRRTSRCRREPRTRAGAQRRFEYTRVGVTRTASRRSSRMARS